MQDTSQAYKDAVYAPARQVLARITVDVSDVEAEGDVTAVNNSTQSPAEAPYISNKAQMNDDLRRSTYKLATWEPDRLSLDGSFSFPDSVVANNGIVGFASNMLSDAQGIFLMDVSGTQLPPWIVFDFGSQHTSPGVTVTFNPDDNEYATDFRVFASRGSGRGGVIVEDITITGNTLTTVDVTGNFLNYDRVFVEVRKWNKPFRRMRMQEVDFGLVKVFDGNSLITCNLTEQFDMTSGQLPSPEFTFTLDNSDRQYNILNPTGFAQYLQQRQTVEAELGVVLESGDVEYVPLGKYLLWEWTSEEGSMTATFKARTNMDLMSNYTYERLTPVTKSLYDLGVEIFGICGITNFSLDNSLKSITTNSLAKSVDCKTALQMVAIAGMCNIFISRDNIITVEKMLPPTTPVDRIDLDNVYAEPKIELQKSTKQVDVTYWTDLNTSAIASAVNTTVTIGDTLSLAGITLINTQAQAQAVAGWLLAQKSYRNKYSINWRGNPAHELSDAVAIESTYSSTDNNAYITKQTLTFQGYLQVQTEAMG
ncbi:hypothetical protein [Paenibacillus sp. MMO-58]|uniref:hypothetical protein n=1 Tax=Paenibacillus sp. MMO-58 TaxID=3081290 RepID=UPI00301656DB